jgi:hypothetical protein
MLTLNPEARRVILTFRVSTSTISMYRKVKEVSPFVSTAVIQQLVCPDGFFMKCFPEVQEDPMLDCTIRGVIGSVCVRS